MSLSYGENNRVLNNITCHIKPKEKVGKSQSILQFNNCNRCILIIVIPRLESWVEQELKGKIMNVLLLNRLPITLHPQKERVFLAPCRSDLIRLVSPWKHVALPSAKLRSWARIQPCRDCPSPHWLLLQPLVSTRRLLSPGLELANQSSL